MKDGEPREVTLTDLSISGSVDSQVECDARPAALVVDDQRSLADALAERLSLEGFLTAIATSGEEALAAAATRGYDLAFVDVRLPDIIGSTIAAELKKRIPGIRVILVSGLASVVDDPWVNGGPVEGVLPKPWKASELEDMLGRVWTRRGR